jgi:hypothetical protein
VVLREGHPIGKRRVVDRHSQLLRQCDGRVPTSGTVDLGAQYERWMTAVVDAFREARESFGVGGDAVADLPDRGRTQRRSRPVIERNRQEHRTRRGL